MATTTLPFSAASSSPTLCRFTQRETSSLPLSLSKPTSLALLTRPTLSPPPSTYSLFACHRRPFPSPSISTARPAFSTVARFSESEAPPVAAADDSPTEVALATVESSPTEESSEAAQVALPAPKREEIFAVVMVGSRQYIVFPGRWIITQRLKGANVNDKIILNKVLLVGTKASTYIGKPVVTNAAVHAVVEEQMLDKKVIVFKYKKKKNYRRNIGHRQPITRIRITGITGYEDYPASHHPTS